MKQPLARLSHTLPKPILPSWIFDRQSPKTLEDSAFASGSALALLHVVLHDPNIHVPSELLRNRLAFRAAVHCSKIEGRAVTEADIRDAYLLTLPGDTMGPDGDMLSLWRTCSDVGLRNRRWQTRLATLMLDDFQETVTEALDLSVSGAGGPVAKATTVLTRILAVFPRQEAMALLCADAVLSHALGWSYPLPLLALYLKRSDLRQAVDGEDIQIACHIAIGRGAQRAVRMSYDLARRAHHLRSVARKIRTKGSDDAIRLFLSEDAVLVSSMLSPSVRGSNRSMTPRSARRLCDRLVDLDAVRELTGRKTFRLYGVA